MKIPTYIVKNYLSQYYFRIHVDKVLIPIVGKSELRKSLQTTCPVVAMERARPYLIAVKAWFQKLKEENGMATDDVWWKIATKVVTIGEIIRSPDGSVKITDFSSDGTREDQETLNRLLGDSPPVTHSTSNAAPPGSVNPELLSTRLALFIKTRKNGKSGFEQKTESAYQGVVDLFIEIFGDKFIHLYTEDDAVRFRDTLLEMPPKYRYLKKWKEMSIEQIIELDPEEKLSPKRVHDQLVRMRTLWAMAVKKKTAVINIFDDVDVEYDVIRGKPFSHPELCDILNPTNMEISPAYPSHYWALLIALFTGMRRSEIFFRTVDEIKEENGIWYFDITRTGDKKTKNKASVRTVPVHSELIRLGFLDYLDKLRLKNSKSYIFPEYNNTGGQAGNKFTDFFIEYRRKLGIDEPGKKFHSFRNTFVVALESNKTYSPLLSRLIGHYTGTMTHDGYGGYYSLQDLSEAVEQIKFPNVTCVIPKWVA